MISVDGGVTTKLLPESGELSIGRASDCDVVIPHASVSRHHATLAMKPLEVCDVGSRNGTRVRGKTLPPGVHAPLGVGDAIQVGEATILIQSAQLSFDGKPMLDVPDREVQALDLECARSARTGSPFAVVVIAAQTPRPKEVLANLRAFMRTTDNVRLDGVGFQVVLTDTGGEQVGIAVARLDEVLARQGIAAQFGVARYPVDGVVPEQLLAHAYEQLERGPRAPSTAMDDVRAMIGQVATGELSVLITGETGVGKELCAEMIHRLSPRAARPFVKLNCSAFVETLIESELFGHERGAFTGATSARAGMLETGNTGTVFLDEIGELPLGVQAKLLRVLEERLVRRVGATAERKVDVRFIFATNRDLIEEVAAGRFRRDLYYRINGVTIEIPPLRERRSEIVPLARAFAGRTRPGPIALGKEVVAALEHHSWPGNIRELRNTIERAVLISSGGTIRPTHLVLEAMRESSRESRPYVRESQPTMPIERVSAETIERPPIRSSNQSLQSEVEDLERQRILEALEQCGGNQSRAAKLLGISRNTLLSRLDQYGVPRPRKS